MPGKKPASAMPSRKRTAWKPSGPVTNSVQAETIPHVTMMRAIHLRAPKRCSARLLGTSRKKQAMKKTPAPNP